MSTPNVLWYPAARKGGLWHKYEGPVPFPPFGQGRREPFRFGAVCGRFITSTHPGLPAEQVSSADRCPGCMRREASEG